MPKEDLPSAVAGNGSPGGNPEHPLPVPVRDTGDRLERQLGGEVLEAGDRAERQRKARQQRAA
jgi:hypothetical protein